MGLLERKCASGLAITTGLEVAQKRILLSTVPVGPLTGLRIKGYRVSDLRNGVYRVAVDLVIRANLAEGSYVLESPVRARQVNLA